MTSLFFGFIAIISLAVIPCGAQGIITTVAGSPNCCTTGDGGPAINAWLGGDGGITIDQQGNLYIFSGTASIRKITPAGIITTIAGGAAGYSGDGGPAINAKLNQEAVFSGLTIDSSGNIYISDTSNNVIRMINAGSGIITTVAGNGTPGFSGDNGPATKAQLFQPAGIAVDGAGNLYIADSQNNRVRKVTAGVISTFAGNGQFLYSGDGVAANTTAIDKPLGLATDNAGNVYIAEDNRIRKVDTSGNITTIAGATSPAIGNQGFSGDGGPATAALLSAPIGLIVDPAGNLYIGDTGNLRIRKINTGGTITTYAGIPGNTSSPQGNGGPATSAYIGNANALALDSSGNLYCFCFPGDYSNIRKIAPGTAAVSGLAASPTTLSFSFTSGGPAPASQSVNVTSTGAALSFVSAATGGNWLTVSPASGTTTPATLTVSVNAAGLSPGSYQGTITLTASGVSPLPISVTLTVSGAGAPVINSGGILNASGYQATLAPDTVFVIFGSGMGPAALAQATAPNYPANISGTSISFTPAGGGAPIAAKMIYTSANQVAGLLPSSAAPGAYAVQLTYNNQTSAPQNVMVVARSFGIATANASGGGAAQATDGNVNNGISLVRLTSGSVSFENLNWSLGPAHPGDTLVLWGTGGGADAANDTGGTSGDQTAAGNFSVIVDGVAIKPVYAGASSGYPGLWQINFTLPANIAPDCFAYTQVSAGGQLSNGVTIAIGPPGATSCSTDVSPSTLSKLDGGGNITFAGLVIGQLTSIVSGTTTVSYEVGGVINQYTAAEWLISFEGPQYGACHLLNVNYPPGGKYPAGPDLLLDAGSVKISGPNGLSTTLGQEVGPNGPAYFGALPASAFVPGGNYTLTGAGGSQVGPFSVSVTFPNNFTVTNLSSLATVNRSQPLTVNWTGSGFNQVVILVQGVTETTTNIHDVAISCTVPASLGTYSVPAAALAFLPAGAGQVSVTADESPLTSITGLAINASLAGGGQIDFGGFSSFIGFLLSATIQ